MIEVTTAAGTKMVVMWRHIDTFFSNGRGTTIYLAGSKNSISAREDYETVKKLISTAIMLESGCNYYDD